MSQKSASVSSHARGPSDSNSATAIMNLNSENKPEPTSLEVSQSLTSDDDEVECAQREQRKLEKRLVRKLDMCLLPVLILMCILQSIDKNLIGIAKINGIERDLQLTQRQFNAALSAFQITYLLLQLPSNMIITHIRPSLYLAFCCFGWSTISVCHAATHNYSQLIVVRSLLGAFDAPFFVGAIHVLSCWYTRQELAKRTSVLLASLIVAYVVFSPVSAAAMDALDGRNGWKGWRWLYLLFGLSGVVASVFAWLLLPDYPECEPRRRRFWLTEGELTRAKQRMEADRVGEHQFDRQRVWVGLKDALKDTRTWIFVLMFISRKSLDGLQYYLPAIIKSLHLLPNSSISQTTLTLLLGCPPAALAAILSVALAYTSDRYAERTYHTAIPLLAALIGIVVSAVSLDSIARYFSMSLYIAGSISSTGLAWSWVPNTIQETPEKKACAIALSHSIGGLGSIWAPFFFRSQDYPRYELAFWVIAGFVVIDVACCLAMRRILVRQNRKLVEEEAVLGIEEEDVKKYVL